MALPDQCPVAFLPLGAIIQSFKLGSQDIALGFPKQEHYSTQSHPYFGETIGRIANRLSNGKIVDLNGRDYEFVKNEQGITTLHGGIMGWGKLLWEGPNIIQRDSREVYKFVLKSADGDEGFPGEVEARIYYGVQRNLSKAGSGQELEEVILDVEYEVEMVGDEADIRETVVTMTNHGYWNLTGAPTVAGTLVTFATNLHLNVDENLIPTGEITPLEGIPAGEPIMFDDSGPAIDHCFVLDTDVDKVPIDTRSRELRTAITFFCPETKMHLEVSTTEPSFQFYSGDMIDVAEIAGNEEFKSVPRRGPRSGIAVEPNRYVDAVNKSEWRSLVLLEKGKLWGCKNRYRAWRS